MARRKRMSSVDHAWLRMDAPNNLMIITTVMMFEGKLDFTALKARVTETLLQYPQFKSRVVREGTNAWWEEDDEFDLDNHLLRVRLPGKADKAELEKYVARVASTRLERRRPMWQFLLAENYTEGDAIIARVHHCIGDGIALVSVMLAMTEGDAAPTLRRNDTMREHRAEHNPWAALLKPVTRTIVGALNTAGNLAEKHLADIVDADKMADYGKLASQMVKDAVMLAAMPNDTTTSLKGVPGVEKMVAWNEPIRVDEIKAVGKALGCSINDVVMACAAGALRHYLVQHRESLDQEANLRAMIPVNLRAPGTEWKLGNKFGLVPLTLPIGIEHPLARLLEVRTRMNELKEGTQAVLAMTLLGVVGFAPKIVQQEILGYMANKATMVMSNVPGPKTHLSLAGAKLRQIMFWVPQSGDIGIGISILSYAGYVQMGIIADRNLCPDPHAICDRFAHEFEQLVMGTLTMPWWPAMADAMQAKFEAATETVEALASTQNSPIPAAQNEPVSSEKILKTKLKKKSAFAKARG